MLTIITVNNKIFNLLFILFFLFGCTYKKNNNTILDVGTSLKNAGYNQYDCSSMSKDVGKTYFSTSADDLFDDYRLDSCTIYINSIGYSKLVLALKKENNVYFKDIKQGEYEYKKFINSRYDAFYIESTIVLTKTDSFAVFSYIYKCRFCFDSIQYIYKKHYICRDSSLYTKEFCYVHYLKELSNLYKIKRESSDIIDKIVFSQ
ncbi:MAG TPA: hypothetical protein PK230_01870 [Chitinophagales bacterium]|nr:hypothetical protein [Chitinophagales bacterium]